ncbi:unnamed protein product [Didymodactylos carnosus]|uniref:Uncharacterized protein n=1 Tax=Didymodactylos carnosus TaxID=1234261 RepID=A0A814RAW3_9BILA|nr:unnamed protein product [Didymodactylos carnosus]CAF1324734.1 unnamed protein product [Didymodactylos carnosus]CAF3894706.1 unnamed protein product [Didymodactylos carnosus]CAF4135366.1 unnamed protein product [Didymodactylos carnosus]
MVLGLILAAGALGLGLGGGYIAGKRRERRKIVNGYVTFNDQGHRKPYSSSPRYDGNGYYGNHQRLMESSSFNTVR